MSHNRWVQGLLCLCAIFCLSACELTDEERDAIDSGLNPPEHQPPDTVRPTPKPLCFEHKHYQPPAEVTKKIDILFVVDSSGSLNSERETIGDGVDAFVAELPVDADVRIAVMPAHATTWSGRIYRRKADTPWVLDNQTMSLADIRAVLRYRMRNVAGENITDGGETGVYSLDQAMEETQLTESKGHGFFREDAALAVVFVADENDICARYPEGVVQVPDPNRKEGPAFNKYCQDVTSEGVYTRLRDFQGDRPLLVSGIVYHEESNFPNSGENEIGYGYLEMIRAANGVAVDLSGGRLHEGLGQIGSLVTKRLSLKTEFALDRQGGEIRADSVEVEVDGVAVDFDFVPTVDEVHLTGYAGQENSEVYIGYCVKDVDNETMPVEISQVEVIAITSNSAKVIWKTDVYSTSQVELRDEFTGWVYMGRLDPQLVRNHMVDLTELGLRSNSLYTIRVMSAIEGDPTISDPVSFRTRR